DIDLAPANLAVTPEADLEPGATTIDYSFDILNNGADMATDVDWVLVYSADVDIDPSTDLVLDMGTQAAIAGSGSASVSGSVLIPVDGAITTGEGFIGVFADPADSIEESDEDNNATSLSVDVQ